MRVFIYLLLLLIGWLNASMAQRPVPPEPAPGQGAPQPAGPGQMPPADQTIKLADRDADQNPVTEYTGPAILSRGFSSTRPSLLEPIRFRPFFGVSGIYDTGLTGVLFNKQNQLEAVDSFGVEAIFGIGGRRIFKRDIVGLEYRGNIFHYTPNSFYDGSNHLFSLDVKHQAAKHLSLNLKETAGVYSNNYALLNGIGSTDPSIAGTDLVVTPNTQAFDNRVIFLSSQADVVFQKSARLSFNMGGGGFLVRRRSSSLYGVSGFQARGDATYRITKRTTVGGYYAYSHYDFTKAFGGSDVHTVGLDYSMALNRTLELRLRVGASRVETLGLITVEVDPVIAAILGQTIGIQTIYRVNFVPDFSGQLTKQVRNGSATLEYSRGVTPGNGLYLTSQRDSAGAHAEYNGIHRYAIAFGAGRDALTSLGTALGHYTSYYGRAGVVRNLKKSVQTDGHVEFRRYSIDSSRFQRNQVRVSIGFTFSPSERPLSVW